MLSRVALRAVAMLVVAGVVGACASSSTSATPASQSAAIATSSPPGSLEATPLPSPVDVNFGIDGFGSAVVIYMAKNQGFFEKHGINATIDTFGVGVDTLNAALTGREDFGFAFDFGSTGAMASNQLRYVAAIARGKGGFQQLAIRENIKDATDLKGKKIGMVTGTTSHFVALKYLEKIGIPASDVELIGFGDVLTEVVALRTGQIDGAWIGGGQAIDEAKTIKGVRLVADDTTVISRSSAYLIATRAFVENEPDALKRVMEALIEAAEWYNASDENKKTAAEHIAAELKVPVEGVAANLGRQEIAVTFDSVDRSTLADLIAFRELLPGATPIGDPEEFIATDALESVAPSAVE